MHEIITLQLGNLSNYTATHFWNAQESYFTYAGEEEPLVDHDVHWRVGIGADGVETFLPRTVLYDLKGGFGSLRKINSLYDAGTDAVAAAESIWAYFHPRSLVQLYDFELDSAIRPFERFDMGTELFTSLDKEHDILDRDWRSFSEECDLMQGIQAFTTIDDAWGGFASSYLEALRDEYPKTCIWVWGIQSPLLDISREKRQLRLSNTAQSLQQASTQASMVVPLALPESQLRPHIGLDCHSSWHVSSLLAAICESALIPSRLKGYHGASLADTAETLNSSGNRTIVSAVMSIPAEQSGGVDMGDTLSFFQVGQDSSKVKHRPERIFGQVMCHRGPNTEQTEPERTADSRRRQVIGNPVTRNHFTELQFPLLDSYPHIYRGVMDRQSIPVRTVLKTNTSISTRLKGLRSQGTRLVPLEEREALSHGLAEIADAYRDGWSSGSDEDEDEL
ncbi:Tubulin FtsZ [Metarhizium album ARSEF 1941]|uniref:Tubulin FtsZ n=1 Tax=Metarhizium album (strain ARSEF 1941) TaxID=1081103 RepID=A0A0B2X6F8_METAS|nr:Tubulin FtsZ [Metarhizium album ARSEF 1941]KHO00871.1 Tubulin FtsZ [Metarhizium album ARSEF 1941]